MSSADEHRGRGEFLVFLPQGTSLLRLRSARPHRRCSSPTALRPRLGRRGACYSVRRSRRRGCRHSPWRKESNQRRRSPRNGSIACARRDGPRRRRCSRPRQRVRTWTMRPRGRLLEIGSDEGDSALVHVLAPPFARRCWSTASTGYSGAIKGTRRAPRNESEAGTAGALMSERAVLLQLDQRRAEVREPGAVSQLRGKVSGWATATTRSARAAVRSSRSTRAPA